jgi:hypothetical protein
MNLVLVDQKQVSKLKAAGESARRTFVQAAIPAAVLAWQASGYQVGKAALLTVLGAGASAGVAAVMRMIKPLSTDQAGAHVA